jgi:hypothetical protein
LIPRQQSVATQKPANNKPIRIRAKDQSNFIQRQQQALRPREQQEFTNPPELLGMQSLQYLCIFPAVL